MFFIIKIKCILLWIVYQYVWAILGIFSRIKDPIVYFLNFFHYISLHHIAFTSKYQFFIRVCVFIAHMKTKGNRGIVLNGIRFLLFYYKKSNSSMHSYIFIIYSTSLFTLWLIWSNLWLKVLVVYILTWFLYSFTCLISWCFFSSKENCSNIINIEWLK